MRDYRFPPKKNDKGTNMDLEETHSFHHFGASLVQQVSGCFSAQVLIPKCAEPLLPRSINFLKHPKSP